MVIYFPRYLIGSILTTCFAVVIKILGKYMPMCLTLSCAKGAVCMWQNIFWYIPYHMWQNIFWCIPYHVTKYILHKYVLEKRIHKIRYWSRLRMRVISRRVYILNQTYNATRKRLHFCMNMWCRTIYLRHIAQLLTKNLWCTMSNVSPARFAEL